MPIAIRAVSIRNFRSIEAVDIDLGDLAILIGRNGAGKSNFIDAIRFLHDCLSNSLEFAIRIRGGIEKIRRYSPSRPHNIAFRLDLNLAERIRRFPFGYHYHSATYCLEIRSKKDGAFEVAKEQLLLSSDNEEERMGYNIIGDSVEIFAPEKLAGFIKNIGRDGKKVVSKDSIMLSSARGFPGFYEIVDMISEFEFFNIDPNAIRAFTGHDSGEKLFKDGSNVASVIKRLMKTEVGRKRISRTVAYLQKISPEIYNIGCQVSGPNDVLTIDQDITSDKKATLYAPNISDGTLRSLGIMAALMTKGGVGSFFVIEEPEIAVHPGATLAIMDAILEASLSSQILLSTHSPSILDHERIDPDALIAATKDGGISAFRPISKEARDAVKEHLISVGELLRAGQLFDQSNLVHKSSRKSIFLPIR
jgi:predicted ATPase